LPSKSPELLQTICERIAQGESLRAICASDGMPAMSTVFLWLNDDSTFSEQYARARETQADAFADEIVAIADEPPQLVMTGDGEETEVALDGAAIQRQRLRIDARKWVASKLKPKKYGEKVDHDVTGSITVNVLKCA
jgi:hypothetical protein